jgi:hypothetical protein
MLSTRALLAIAGILMLIATPQNPALDIGVISGNALQEARRPYSDYLVRARDAETGQPAGLSRVGEGATFSVDMLPANRPLLIELHNTKDQRIVCVQGPYRLAPDAPVRTDLMIECGKKAAARWLLPASKGIPAAVSFAVHGVSR